MALALKAGVGEKKRSTKGPVPKNAPDDVKLVQLMLIANGISGPLNGKCDAGLIKAIKGFQKSKVSKQTDDGVVDPGSPTWNAGLPKLKAKVAADLKALESLVAVVEGGKTKYVTKAEFERNEAALQKKVLAKANMMHGRAQSWIDFARKASETAAGADGLMNAFAAFVVSKASGGKSDPPYAPLTNARSDAALLRALAKNKTVDWKQVQAQDSKATKSFNAGGAAFYAWIDSRISVASNIVGNLEVVREISFAVVEAYITAELVAKRKMSPAQAHAIAAASTETMKSGAGQLGEYLAGNEVTWEGAAKKMYTDALFSGLAGAAGGKITSAFSKKLTIHLAKTLLPQVAKTIPQKAADVFLTKIVTAKPMQGVIESGAKETIGLFKPLLEKGRGPNEQEVTDALLRTITAGALKCAPIKSLKAFDQAAPGKAGSLLTKTVTPQVSKSVRSDLAKKLGADAISALPKDIDAEIAKDVLTAFRDKTVEVYVLAAANGSNGETDEAGLHKLGESGVLQDAKLGPEIDAMVRQAMERKLKSSTKGKKAKK